MCIRDRPLSFAAEHGAFYKENGVWHKNVHGQEWSPGLLSILKDVYKRQAKARGMSEETVKASVDKAVEKPFMGMFGTEKVNVLKLNAALEKAKIIKIYSH